MSTCAELLKKNFQNDIRSRGQAFSSEPLSDSALNPKNNEGNVDTQLSEQGNNWHTCQQCSTRCWYCLPSGKSLTDFNCAEGRDPKKVSCLVQPNPYIMGTGPPKRDVECLKCGERRLVPDSIDIHDLPPDWNCSLRTWSVNPTKLGFDEFYGCNYGKINNSLIKAHAAVLATKRAEASEAIFEHRKMESKADKTQLKTQRR
jgi:hypothetical protein